MTVDQPAGSRSGMLSTLSAGPCFREKCTESKRDEKLLRTSVTGACSQCESCALGETGRARRHLHSSTCQWKKSGALKMQQAPMQSPSYLLGDYRFIFLKESLSGLSTDVNEKPGSHLGS